MHFSRRSLLCLPFVPVLHADEGDSAVILAMSRAYPHLKQRRVWRRIRVNDDFDVVLILAASRLYPSADAGDFWWGTEALLGLFVQPIGRPQLVYQVVIENGFADGECSARLERATATDLVIACMPEKGNQGANRKFTYDIRAKVLLSRIDYDRIPMTAAYPDGSGAVLLGSDRRTPVALEYTLENEFRFLQGTAAGRWTSRLRPTPAEPLRFGPGNRFAVAPDENRGMQVTELGPKISKAIPFPQPTSSHYVAARPGNLQNRYLRDHTKMEVTIGAWQIFEGTVWFGQSFYDSEGISGVGGFGHFNTTTGRYEIQSPPEIIDSSVTAILVEQNAVWLATARRGEWGDTSRGLLRFDRAAKTIEKIALGDLTSKILRVGSRVVLATNFGIAILEDGKVRRYFADRMKSGGLRVVEATVAR